MKDLAWRRVLSNGSQSDIENSAHNDALERTYTLHERQTRAMLCGAILVKKSEDTVSSVGQELKFDLGMISLKI